ncbi:MAG TPA: heptosyltransferase [Pusillimonas sp.]|jgi:heptosyltransferase-2|nr:heptosyltransferase [Pusillimonas sp.]|tara:strand:- start:136457 stop:137383 length:927 start_codon:yes stop_codon:yes gene_type:complete
MALPSLHAIVNSGMPTVICARPWAQDLIRAYCIEGFIPMSGAWKEDRKRVAKHKRRHNHDRALGLLLPDSLSSALVFRLAGLQCAGYRDDGRSLLLKWPFSKPSPRPHAVESWFMLTRLALTAWDCPLPALKPDATLGLSLDSEHEAAATALLARAGLEPGGFVLIAPTATGRHKGQVKVWPGFDSLTRALQDKGFQVVMCPPPNEKDEALQNAPTARCLDTQGLGAFATLTRMSALVICNDSGVSHLAAAANARQITLFGVTDAERTGPWSPSATCLGKMGQWPSTDSVLQHTMQLLNEPSPSKKSS